MQRQRGGCRAIGGGFRDRGVDLETEGMDAETARVDSVPEGVNADVVYSSVCGKSISARC
jgi:hypothetical protein